MLEKIFDLIIKYYKKPRLYIALLGILAIVFVAFPYIDANVFYYNRMEKRTDILTKLVELDYEKVNENPIIADEYNAILFEIEQQKTRSIGGVNYNFLNTIIVGDGPYDRIYKFVSGGVLAWLTCVLVNFIEAYKKNKKDKRIVITVMLAVGAILGFIGMNLPTIYNKWVNLIGWPLLQIIILVLISLVFSQKKVDNLNE